MICVHSCAPLTNQASIVVCVLVIFSPVEIYNTITDTNSKNNLLIKTVIVYTYENFFKTMFDDSHG